MGDPPEPQPVAGPCRVQQLGPVLAAALDERGGHLRAELLVATRQPSRDREIDGMEDVTTGRLSRGSSRSMAPTSAAGWIGFVT